VSTRTLDDVIVEALLPYIGAQPVAWFDKVTTDVVNAVVAFQGDETFELRARKNAPATSNTAVDRIKTGTAQSQVLHYFQSSSRGWTDDQLERATGRSHQSVSSVRNILMNKGYVRDTGTTRLTRSGNPAVVYVYTGKEVVR